ALGFLGIPVPVATPQQLAGPPRGKLPATHTPTDDETAARQRLSDYVAQLMSQDAAPDDAVVKGILRDWFDQAGTPAGSVLSRLDAGSDDQATDDALLDAIGDWSEWKNTVRSFDLDPADLAAEDAEARVVKGLQKAVARAYQRAIDQQDYRP